jgi:pseudouridine-5'-phosphate glycosidase
VDALRIHPEVADASAAGHPVVALESTIITHGLPWPENIRAAATIEDAVRAHGAVPATVAIIDGVPTVGLDTATTSGLAHAARSGQVAKCGSRDLAAVMTRGGHGSTTVGGTCTIAAAAGISVFATGAIGGVHRGAATSFDESADLHDLARTGRVVVSAGVKSVLDVAATMERLETLGVPVLGMATDHVPGFWIRETAVAVPHRVENPEDVAAVVAAHRRLGLPQSVLVMNPVPAAAALPLVVHDDAVAQALADAAAAGVKGADVTPFVLAAVHRITGGASVTANIALATANAICAARIAEALGRSTA